MRVIPYERDLPEREKIVRIAMTSIKGGAVLIYALDERGIAVDGGSLVEISQKGVCIRGTVNPDLGFTLDDGSRLHLLGSH